MPGGTGRWGLVPCGLAEGAVWLGLDEEGLVFPLLGGCCSGVRGDPHWLFSSLSLSSGSLSLGYWRGGLLSWTLNEALSMLQHAERRVSRQAGCRPWPLHSAMPRNEDR